MRSRFFETIAIGGTCFYIRGRTTCCRIAGPLEGRRKALPKKRLHRRNFIKSVAAGAGGVAVFSGCSKAPRRWRYFSDSEAATLAAACDQIIPPDEYPGAVQSGVPNFIDRQLLGAYQRFQSRYRSGLAGIDDAARQMFSGSFVSLKWESQTEVLKAMEAGKIKGDAWQEQTAASFFNLVRDHTMQGYYGSPRHGGNKDYASYRMLKVDYPQIIGQNRYRKG
jgi:gluconate 2-dehydrogenase gamma chain